MGQVDITIEMVEDFENLCQAFRFFMSVNLAETDLTAPVQYQEKMKKLIDVSLENIKKLPQFDLPIRNYPEKNKALLARCSKTTKKSMEEYLKFAGNILKTARPDIYNGTFSHTLGKFTRFCNRYGIPFNLSGV